MAKYTRRDILKISAGAAVANPSLGAELHAAPAPETPRAAPLELVADFYVAPNGNDAWSGKLAAADGEKSDGPLATLARARDLVREKKSRKAATQPIAVMVRGGKYYLEDTLVFGAEDGGSRDAMVTYRAYPGEKPILSGGRKVTGWKTYKGKILVAALPATKGGNWKFRQLFLNGERQVRARTPKFDPRNPLFGGWAYMEAPAEKGSITAFKWKPGTIEHHWAKPTQGEVTFYQGTGQWQAISPIKSVDEKNRVITLTRPGYQYDTETELLRADNPFYVSNLLEDLETPGEWCLDSEEGLVYFWPPSGALQPPDEVVAPALHCLVDIQGASWLRFSGFTFTETQGGDNTHHLEVEGAAWMGWQPGWPYCGDSLHMKGAENCTIDHNHFYAVGGNSIYLEGYNARNVIRHNELSLGGANGICLLGTWLAHPKFNTVSDNHIHHIGQFNKYVAGIFSGTSNGNRFSHNNIEYVPHHAINLADNPGGRNIIEYNLMRFTCRELTDTGAINMWMSAVPRPDAERDGHVIRYNYISDVDAFATRDGRMGNHGWSSGIYLDDYTSNSYVYGNIVVRCMNGMQIHAGKNNLVENNIFVNCLRNITFMDVTTQSPGHGAMQGFYAGNHIARNIFYQVNSAKYFDVMGGSNHGGQAVTAERVPVYGIFGGWNEWAAADCDYNLLFQSAEGKYALQDVRHDIDTDKKIATLAQWKKIGYEAHTLIADPLFVDPGKDDYSLQPDSPALKLGFQPIDLRTAGPREDEL